MAGNSPAGPFKCGSTICKVKPIATAASKALPPFSKTPKPTELAIQCVELTIPKVPEISGLVVNFINISSLSNKYVKLTLAVS